MYLWSSEKKDCCGCMACVPVCPENCIAVTVDEEGFEYPVRDAARCTDCGKCTAVCPVVNKPKPASEDGFPKAYAAWSTDEKTRWESSSGGVFSELARIVFREGGVVFGAAFSDDFYRVHHIAVRSEADLCRLRGSKYVQSSTVGVFPQVKELLAQGRKVFFSGTPCQISALHNFIGVENENLITCDLLCYGVPSPLVFEKYIKEQEQCCNSSIKKFSFRDKKNGWNFSSVFFELQNGKYFRRPNSRDVYMHGFWKRIFVRPVCYSCQFHVAKTSSITLGDFWGVQKRDAALDDNKGTSLITINNRKGFLLLENSSTQLLLHKVILDRSLENSIIFIRNSREPLCRKSFFKNLSSGSFMTASELYMNRKEILEITIRSLARKLLWQFRFLVRSKLRKSGL